MLAIASLSISSIPAQAQTFDRGQLWIGYAWCGQIPVWPNLVLPVDNGYSDDCETNRAGGLVTDIDLDRPGRADNYVSFLVRLQGTSTASPLGTGNLTFTLVGRDPNSGEWIPLLTKLATEEFQTIAPFVPVPCINTTCYMRMEPIPARTPPTHDALGNTTPRGDCFSAMKIIATAKLATEVRESNTVRVTCNTDTSATKSPALPRES